MNLNNFLSKLNEEVGDKFPKYPPNDEWNEEYEKILDAAIELYDKHGKKEDFADIAVEEAEPRFFSDDDTDYIYPFYATHEEDIDDEAWWDAVNDIPMTTKDLKKADRDGWTTREFHNYMKGKPEKAWEAVARFYYTLA